MLGYCLFHTLKLNILLLYAMNVTMEQTLKEGDLLWPINHLYSHRKESKTRKFWNQNLNGTEMQSEPEL